MANQILMTLHELLIKLFTDPSFRAEHEDIEELLVEHGHGDVSPGELKQAMALVADDLPPVQAQQLSSYLQASSGATGTSTFNINQGGGAAGTSTAASGGMNAPASGGGGGGTGGGSSGGGAASGGGGGAGAGAGAGGGAGAGVAATPPPPPPPAVANEPPIDTVVREINHITNNITNITETNTTNIDDRDTITDNSVRQSINAGGDVNLDQDITNNTASGDGAVAGAEGNVNTGENSGIVGDASGARVTNLEGDGNTVISDVGEDANVVTGEVGQFVGGDVSESNLIGGDNQGVAITDANVEGVTVGDGNTAVGDVGGNVNLGGSQVNVQGSEAVNLGDGAQNLNVAGGNVNTGSGDVIQAQGAAVNTGAHGEAANANLGGFGQGASDDGGASIAQVNVGSGSADAAIDQSTSIDQQATVNQTQNVAVDGGGHGGGASADGEQDLRVEFDASDEEVSLNVEADQGAAAEHEAVELPEETMAE